MKPKNTFDPRTLFAFESTVWEKADFVFVELTQVFRQDDKFFVDLLNRIRWGTYTPEDQRLLNACTKPLDTTQHLATRLETHRANADSTNERFFEELPDRDTRDYHALDGVSDSFDSHLLKSIEDYVRAPATVKLRRGTQVMLIANLCVTEGLVNGARGVVIGGNLS
ncbi:hypothetical protein BC830DRAFT_927557 [Chytriomyces sp. MP71]|nr:hypothetical protein BC830DRAFT_927557 [Chytriomyces sp. MP71]